ncbi:hypothetical protein VPH35_137576 [Triticum aestivum]
MCWLKLSCWIIFAFTSSCSALVILFPQISSCFAIDVMLYSLTESKPFNCSCTKDSFRLYHVMIFLLAVVVLLLFYFPELLSFHRWCKPCSWLTYRIANLVHG